jgi:transcriptional regulator
MYLPSHFHETDPDVIRQIVTSHPLGVLITHANGELDANHLPFETRYHENTLAGLTAHLAATNPLVSQLTDDHPVLVVFRGPQAYISPNWYPSKHEAHRQVPTWNYQTVHVHGTLQWRRDEDFLRGVLARLTRDHEHRMHPDQAWKMTDAPADYIQSLLQAIVGIDIRITRIEAKSKLSQNKSDADRYGAAHALADRGCHDLACAMTPGPITSTST